MATTQSAAALDAKDLLDSFAKLKRKIDAVKFEDETGIGLIDAAKLLLDMNPLESENDVQEDLDKEEMIELQRDNLPCANVLLNDQLLKRPIFPIKT